MDESVERARRLAPSLVGMRIDDARALISSHPGVYLREVPWGAGVEQSFGFGRITVHIRDERVVQADLG
jgi:hypothetical protein